MSEIGADARRNPTGGLAYAAASQLLTGRIFRHNSDW